MFHDVSLSNLLNGIPHAVVLVGKDLNVAGMNRQAEALTGRSVKDVTGIHAEYILRSNLHPFGNFFQAVIKDRKAVSHEGNILDRNRKIIPVRFSISPIENSNADLLGAMVVMEDLSQTTYLQEKRAGSDGFEETVSLSPKMQEVSEQIPVFAGTDAAVLIDGEIGTGKGSVAETIHKASKRAGYPYIKVNCGALPEPLLESELFGHAQGAFPGADRVRQGMFRLADRGTIFLSEIGEMPLPLQAKLLYVLDDGEVSPLGSTKKVAVNVRIIAATSKDLKALVREGKFREDLFYRLQVLRLHLPALRRRAEDIPLLIDHFIKLFSPGKMVPHLEPEALRVLKDYPYPGNVRELRNIIEYAVTLGQGETIQTGHLPEYVLKGHDAEGYPAYGAESAPELHEARDAAKSKAVKWDDVEKEMIIEALRQARGKRNEAAKILGWARSTLYRKLKYHGI